ncbi:3-keto-disaccharide hydrolase [Caldimonas brevitalea]|uniref:Secreted glycosyl hydrolase n=1 Tax=Caldimonas brevitalea TaxID=413882 RepID=A0A0G3BQL7_9BURK|nr:DUF1080 domain-containing protein [Caldimonas brevitalea]AKJ31737.1 secreted glycosyl hydrolase [Caldimonas brevitalea]
MQGNVFTGGPPPGRFAQNLDEEPLPPTLWRAYRGEGFPLDSWQVHDDDVMQAISGAPAVDLVSAERYADFVLDFEWALPAGGNSGVLYRVHESASAAWQSGPEMQLLDDTRHPDAREPVTRCGSVYGIAPPAPFPLPPIGGFVASRIVVRGWHVEHWLGGRLVLSCDLDEGGLRARIADTKFAEFPNFAREREGHIVLQHHGAAVRFRRLRIRRL